MKLEWNQCSVGWTTQAGDTWATVESDKSGNWMWRIYAPCAKCYTAFGIIPAGPDALAAAKAAAEQALQPPERDPLDVAAEAMGLRWWSSDILHDRNGREVATVCDGEGFIRIYPNDVTDFAKNKRATLRAVATLLGKDQPETPMPPEEVEKHVAAVMKLINEDKPAPQPVQDDDAEAFAKRLIQKSHDGWVIGIDGIHGGTVTKWLTDASVGFAHQHVTAALRERDKRIADEARRDERERIADWLCNRGWTVASDYVRADAAKGAT